MNRRLFRTLIYALVAAQALSLAATATASGQEAAATWTDCADMVLSPDQAEPCPCCPDGIQNVAACLSSCTAAVGAISAIAVAVIKTESEPVPATASLPRAELADPPLKPPPIL